MEDVSTQVIDGRAVAKATREALKNKVEVLLEQGITPGLDVILVGDDPASLIYVRNKKRACERLGMRSRIHTLPATTMQDELEQLICSLNADDTVDGILLQLPLPGDLDANRALAQIDPIKDVDGLHTSNLGRLVCGLPGPHPCTPAGCLTLLDSIGYEVSGKKAVIVGRSQLVGKPMAFLLLQRNATVTICHSRTRDLEAEIRQADIVVAAVGYAELIRGEWIKPGAVILDVGINRREDGSLVGDVDFEGAQGRAAAITPVPGGVGPMTIATLLSNTYKQACVRRGISA